MRRDVKGQAHNSDLNCALLEKLCLFNQLLDLLLSLQWSHRRVQHLNVAAPIYTIGEVVIKQNYFNAVRICILPLKLFPIGHFQG